MVTGMVATARRSAGAGAGLLERGASRRRLAWLTTTTRVHGTAGLADVGDRSRRAQALGASPLAAVLAGLSAHAVVTGCAPDLSRTVLVLPWMLLAVHGLHRLSRQRSPLARAVAGQAVVHLGLALASPCVPHAATVQGGHAGALSAVEAAMTAAHLAAVVACVTILGRTERLLARAAIAAAAGCFARARRRLTPVLTCVRPEHRRPPLPEAEGLHALARSLPGCGCTRGPPPLTACRALP